MIKIASVDIIPSFPLENSFLGDFMCLSYRRSQFGNSRENLLTLT